jgi:hypothetical protein
MSSVDALFNHVSAALIALLSDWHATSANFTVIFCDPALGLGFWEPSGNPFWRGQQEPRQANLVRVSQKCERGCRIVGTYGLCHLVCSKRLAQAHLLERASQCPGKMRSKQPRVIGPVSPNRPRRAIKGEVRGAHAKNGPQRRHWLLAFRQGPPHLA